MDRTNRLSAAFATATLCLVCCSNAAFAASVSIDSVTLVDVGPDCETVRYSANLTGDFETDDGSGIDYTAVLWFDGHGNFIDNDYKFFTSVGQAHASINDFVIASRFVQRPLEVRVYDIPQPFLMQEDSPEAIALAVEGTLLAGATIDPADDAPDCANVDVGRSLRVQAAANTGAQVFSDSVIHALSLDGVGTSMRVTLPEPTSVAAFYTAECAVSGADSNTWLDVDVLANGVALETIAGVPNLNQAFCTSDGDLINNNWVTARLSRFATLPAGDYDFTVTGRLASWGPGEGWRIDDGALVVYLPEPAGATAWLASLALVTCIGRRRRLRGSQALAGAVCALAIAGASPASAGTTFASSQFTGVQTGADGTIEPLDLGGDFSGGTSVGVIARGPSRMVITFTAECAVAGDDDGTWLDIDLLVDGLGVSPTAATEDAFCTSDGNGVIDGWRSASRMVAVDVAAGFHAVSVDAALRNGDPGDTWWLDDIAVSVVLVEIP